MLKLKYLYENFDLARKCMELYDCDKDSAEEMMQFVAGMHWMTMLCEKLNNKLEWLEKSMKGTLK